MSDLPSNHHNSSTPTPSRSTKETVNAWLDSADDARWLSPDSGSWNSKVLRNTNIDGDENYNALVEYLAGYIPAAEVEANFTIFPIADLARALLKAVEEIRSLEHEIKRLVFGAQNPALSIDINNERILGTEANVWKPVNSEYIGKVRRDQKCELLITAQKDIRFLRDEARVELERLVREREGFVERRQSLAKFSYLKMSRPVIQLDLE